MFFFNSLLFRAHKQKCLMVSSMQYIQNFLLQLFLPAFCINCTAWIPERYFLCQSCLKKINPVVSKTIKITNAWGIPVFAIGVYQEPLKQMILAKSWSDYNGAYQLAELMVKMTPVTQLPCDVIIPIPLHWTRLMYRGFNQSALMAHVIGKEVKAPVMPVLKRKKRTLFQSSLKKEDRMTNVEDAFELVVEDRNFFVGKHILLVDDLMTTGATLRNAARLLIDLKPASIRAVVAARTV
jgi:ComF family protein